MKRSCKPLSTALLKLCLDLLAPKCMVDKKQLLQQEAHTVCIEGSFLPLETTPFEKVTKIELAVDSKIKARIYFKDPLLVQLLLMAVFDLVQILFEMDFLASFDL